MHVCRKHNQNSLCPPPHISVFFISLVLLFGALLCIAYSSSRYPLSDMVVLFGLNKAITAESAISSIQRYLVRCCITKPCNIGDDGVIWTWYAIRNKGPGLIILIFPQRIAIPPFLFSHTASFSLLNACICHVSFSLVL